MRIELKDAVIGYRRRAVVRVDALAVGSGRCLGIYGPNGSGKTTLVRAILGLIAPMQGRYDSAGGVRPAYLPQQRELELHWPMSGLDAASLWASAKSRAGAVGAAARQRVRAKMRLLEVEHLADAAFARLSGGQQQRLLLAGLLATEPNLLVLDEPTDGLDARSSRALLAQLRAARDAGGARDAPGETGAGAAAAIVLVSHDVDDLLSTCDDVALIHPAESPDEPARVDVVPAAQVPQRILHTEAPASP